jgi:hypothetical protein
VLTWNWTCAEILPNLQAPAIPANSKCETLAKAAHIRDKSGANLAPSATCHHPPVVANHNPCQPVHDEVDLTSEIDPRRELCPDIRPDIRFLKDGDEFTEVGNTW